MKRKQSINLQDGLSTIEVILIEITCLQMLVSILKKPLRYRTERDLDRLLPIVKTIKFF
jgi:hypothetical protein